MARGNQRARAASQYHSYVTAYSTDRQRMLKCVRVQAHSKGSGSVFEGQKGDEGNNHTSCPWSKKRNLGNMCEAHSTCVHTGVGALQIGFDTGGRLCSVLATRRSSDGQCHGGIQTAMPGAVASNGCTCPRDGSVQQHYSVLGKLDRSDSSLPIHFCFISPLDRGAAGLQSLVSRWNYTTTQLMQHMTDVISH